MPEKRVKNSTTPKQKRTKSRLKTSAKKQSVAAKHSEAPVILPNNMPLRAKEKAAIYRAEFAQLWDPAMSKIAMVSGFCFVLFGASLSLLDSYKGVPFTAQTIDSTDSGVIQNTSEPLVTQAPASFQVSQSSPLSGIVQITISVQHAERVRVRVFGTDGASQGDNLGDANRVSDSVWRIHWDTSRVPDGRYKIVADIENDVAQYAQESTNYRVENNPYVSSEQSGETTTSQPAAESSPSGTSGSGSVAAATYEPIEFKWRDTIPNRITSASTFRFEAKHVNTDYLTKVGFTRANQVPRYLNIQKGNEDRYSFTVDPRSFATIPGLYDIKIQLHHESRETLSATELATRPISPDKVISAGPVFIGTEAQYQTFLNEGNTSTAVVDEVIDITTTNTSNTNTPNSTSGSDAFALSHADSVLTGIEIIKIHSNQTLTKAELYARNRSNGSEVYLASGEYISGQMTFRVFTRALTTTGKALPNGEYDLYATARKSDGSFVTSSKLRVSVYNEPSQTTTSQTQTGTSVTNATPLPSTDTTQIETRKAEENYVRQTTSDTLKLQTTTILRNEEEAIRSLLREYANAEASGDQDAVAEARANIKTKREEIVFAAKQDESLRDVAETLDATLTEHVEDLQQRVQKFEAVKRNREQNTEDATKDSDNDGISDVDERNLYGTNPESADSDNDGVSDADELVRGRNPIDSSETQTITFENPKESVALVRDDVLVVSQIRTVNTDNSNDVTPGADGKVQFWGNALPNSFVTLYIFSTPIVVTIKTDADGSFVYTLDRELEDGDHDVYVAVTDNTGSIVAQSNPFSFIKQAQAFTPVDAAEANVVSNETAIEPTSTLSSTGTVVGLGVLSLGLILLMLGVSLRLRQPELVSESTEGSTPAETEPPKPVAVSERKFEHIDASES